MGIGNANIAFCFNSETEAKAWAAKLNGFSPETNFIISPTFEGFLKAIAKVPKVDYFIIESAFKECPATELIEKLKASQRYKKSLISVFSENGKKLDPKYHTYKLDFVFDAKTDIQVVHNGLEQTLSKKLTPAIPDYFNVLVIDDEPEILNIISTNIAELGNQNIDTSTSVIEAKKKLLEKEYDLILLDWNLGDGTCMDVMDYIKKTPVSPRTKSALAMVITGRNSVEDLMTLLSYGVKDTIIKPFDLREFEDKISYAVEKHLKHPKT